MANSHGKNANGIGSNLNAGPKGEKGRNIAMAIIAVVSANTGAVAQLWMKGILFVRMI